MPKDHASKFFDSLPEAAYVLDRDYNLITLNEAACRLHEITREEAIAQKCHDLFCHKKPCLNCPVEEVFTTGLPVEKEMYREKNETWHFLRAFPLFEDGKVVRVGTINRDVTSTKTAERILIDFNYKIKNFIDRMPIGCILWDEDFKVAIWNPSAEKIFGYSEAEAKGRHPYSLIVPPDVVQDTEPVKEELQQGSDNSHREGENITKDGRRIFCNWLNTPVRDAGGKVIAILSMVQDITHQKQLQSEAIRTAQLASIGQLAASTAHEINNPIGGVINYTQILLNRSESLPEKDIELLRKIRKEGERVAQIVSNLLNFARKPPESTVRQDIELMIKDALDLLEPETRKTGAKVSVNLMESNPVMRCNPQQIVQILINILKNALDALGENDDGQRLIKISSQVRQHESRREFILTIANNGPHIPEQLQKKIFEPFMTTKRKGLGTGLGLGISLEIMKNHGGSLEFRSGPDQPTEFDLVFPLQSSN